MPDTPGANQAQRTPPTRSSQFGVDLDPNVVWLSVCAMVVGLIGGLVAQGLLELIYLFTNIFFYGTWSFAITYPIHHRLGVDIPELDYPKLITLDGAVAYLAAMLRSSKT